MNIEPKLETSPILDDKHILWDADTVKKTLGLRSDSGLYSAMDKQGLPRPIKLGSRKALWVKAEVLEYIDKKVAERDAVAN